MLDLSAEMARETDATDMTAAGNPLEVADAVSPIVGTRGKAKKQLPPEVVENYVGFLLNLLRPALASLPRPRQVALLRTILPHRNR